jgi:hypothetical protein
MNRFLRIGISMALSGCLLLASHAAPAQPSTALDPAALAILSRMADQLRGLPSLRVEAQVEYDAFQSDGQTIEFGSTRELALRRPDRLHVHATDRAGAQRDVFYDGQQLAFSDRSNAVYATLARSGDIDAILRYVADELGMPVPLGDLVSADLGRQLDEQLVVAALVGPETIEGVPCDHLALRNRDRGIQIWVQQGETPLPRRISITWEQAAGRPQFRANFTKWELSPQLPDALFTFEPPADAERIQFLAPFMAETKPAGGR